MQPVNRKGTKKLGRIKHMITILFICNERSDSGPRFGIDELGQYKTPDMRYSVWDGL